MVIHTQKLHGHSYTKAAWSFIHKSCAGLRLRSHVVVSLVYVSCLCLLTEFLSYIDVGALMMLWMDGFQPGQVGVGVGGND